MKKKTKQGLPENNEIVAVRFKNNWDGEGDIQLLFAYVQDGKWLCHDTMQPLIEYVGDEVVEWWPLKPGTGVTYPQSSGCSDEETENIMANCNSKIALDMRDDRIALD